ncbi:TIGR01777 family oxidoreductase [Sulfurovum sp. zt1-1]|uniref:TIGR01777 family oxidoreductase n=1 Tax=Sulfurovum zhangzhouensis TaxID=3019067 RepID=A0ABT7QV24_9BACT|nr:TIGR01777 family oxidoreductase [Sulfurovum zhangzhouensis]MDM5270571.1 TIGR01777 family oxidoreductase [Sulfurovum zhangzhouensis]
MKKIAITGASGFIGTYMQSFFKDKGYEVLPVSRKDIDKDTTEIAKILEQTDIVINLAGAPIIHRWSESYKEVLYNSRILTTRKIVEAMKLMNNKPELFISTSAIGIYATNGPMSEANYTYGDNFLSKICKDWEAEANEANEVMRVVIFRFGVVLSKGGGALSKMLPAFRLGIAGTIGDGSEPFSWVHIDDLMAAYLFVINNENQKGTFNLCAPNPVTNKELTKTLGKVLHRPTVIPLPKFVLRVLFSEGATVLTEGQRVIPERLLENHFTFKYPTIEEALREVLDKPK